MNQFRILEKIPFVEKKKRKEYHRLMNQFRILEKIPIVEKKKRKEKYKISDLSQFMNACATFVGLCGEDLGLRISAICLTFVFFSQRGFEFTFGLPFPEILCN